MSSPVTTNAFTPISRRRLSDSLVARIRILIESGTYQEKDRLPATMELARRFGVSSATVREAMRKLETMGMVEIRHGSGVYVSRSQEVLVLASPDYAGAVTRKLLLDLVDTRTPIELHSVRCAARSAEEDDLREMRSLLVTAARNLDDDEILNSANMGFHRRIARASRNAVLAQLLDVLQALFAAEQAMILRIHGSRQQDHAEHVAILEALEMHDEELAVERMRRHFLGIEAVLEAWNPETHPVR